MVSRFGVSIEIEKNKKREREIFLPGGIEERRDWKGRGKKGEVGKGVGVVERETFWRGLFQLGKKGES
jgi:hypothetical protein